MPGPGGGIKNLTLWALAVAVPGSVSRETKVDGWPQEALEVAEVSTLADACDQAPTGVVKTTDA